MTRWTDLELHAAQFVHDIAQLLADDRPCDLVLALSSRLDGVSRHVVEPNDVPHHSDGLEERTPPATPVSVKQNHHWSPPTDMDVNKDSCLKDNIEQCLTSTPTQYRLSGRQFYRSKDPTNSIKVLTEKRYKSEENPEKANNTKYSNTINPHTHTKHRKSPSLH